MSSAAVARSWGDKVHEWMISLGYENLSWMNPIGTVSIIAGLMEILCLSILLAGVHMVNKEQDCAIL